MIIHLLNNNILYAGASGTSTPSRTTKVPMRPNLPSSNLTAQTAELQSAKYVSNPDKGKRVPKTHRLTNSEKYTRNTRVGEIDKALERMQSDNKTPKLDIRQKATLYAGTRKQLLHDRSSADQKRLLYKTVKLSDQCTLLISELTIAKAQHKLEFKDAHATLGTTTKGKVQNSLASQSKVLMKRIKIEKSAIKELTYGLKREQKACHKKIERVARNKIRYPGLAGDLFIAELNSEITRLEGEIQKCNKMESFCKTAHSEMTHRNIDKVASALDEISKISVTLNSFDASQAHSAAQMRTIVAQPAQTTAPRKAPSVAAVKSPIIVPSQSSSAPKSQSIPPAPPPPPLQTAPVTGQGRAASPASHHVPQANSPAGASKDVAAKSADKMNMSGHTVQSTKPAQTAPKHGIQENKGVTQAMNALKSLSPEQMQGMMKILSQMSAQPTTQQTKPAAQPTTHTPSVSKDDVLEQLKGSGLVKSLKDTFSTTGKATGEKREDIKPTGKSLLEIQSKGDVFVGNKSPDAVKDPSSVAKNHIQK